MKKLKVTYENNWDYTEIHIDLPVPYEENYQMDMLNNNEISCLLKVKGSGRDGKSRYTYRLRNGISMEKQYAGTEMKKEDIEEFVKGFADAVQTIREYLLNPDCILLSPEFVFLSDEGYRFCYLPVLNQEYKKPVCRSFHEMTEYFVKKLDYEDTDGVFLVYKLHRETMKDSYELTRIMKECEIEEKKRMEEKKKEKEDVISCEAVFSVDEEEAEHEEHNEKKKEPKKHRALKRAMRRIRIGQWGEWNDLITEMDGHDSYRHL